MTTPLHESLRTDGPAFALRYDHQCDGQHRRATDLSEHTITFVDPADPSTVVATAFGVYIAGHEGGDFWGRLVEQGERFNQDMGWVTQQIAAHGPQIVGVDDDPWGLCYLATVEVDRRFRGLGLGQFAASRFLESVGSGAIASVVAGFSPGSHNDTERSAIDKLVDGLPLQPVGDPAGRFFASMYPRRLAATAVYEATMRVFEAAA